MVQVRVFVLPGGNIQIFGDTGTDEEATIATRKVLAKLQAHGISFESIGEIEFHRTGDSPHVHVFNKNEVQQHDHNR